MTEPRDTLDSWLATARADVARQESPAWIESALVARQSERLLLRRLRPSTLAPQPRPRRWLAWGLPAGAVALLVAGAGAAFLTGAPATVGARSPAFMALTPLETIAAEPRPIVITSEVPRAQLAALGLPVDPARADLPVRAEFLVSQRGALLAVRFSPQ